jgi:putative peptidoglycan lipid II flippase
MVKNIIRGGTELLFRKQTNILSAATVIATAVLFSRILGLLKFRLLTDRFSVNELGLFFAAFRLPSTIFDLIVMGALTTAFIPVFTSLLDQNKQEEANKVASVILNISLIIFGILSIASGICQKIKIICLKKMA